MTPGETKVFAIGSCFAVEVRAALRALGFDVYPKYRDIDFDPARQQPCGLPYREDVNHYDTFTIRQELERAIDGGEWNPDHFWRLEQHRFGREKGWRQVHCDPYRRKMFARDRDALIDLSRKVGRCIDEGLRTADVIIITLGLTECWRAKGGAHHVCVPAVSEADETQAFVDFHPSTFQENYDNVAATIRRLSDAFPHARIVLTVSPVALGRTWTDNDVVVANMASKTTLRAVANEICRVNERVTYWPSYEFAMMEDVFLTDGRHVKRSAVKRIISAFLDAHQTPAAKPATRFGRMADRQQPKTEDLLRT